MIIAVCDYDAVAEPNRFFPNLEVMKLSSYYKTKNHLTYSIFDLKDQTLFTTASKVIIRKDRKNLKIPTDVLGYSNVTYGGLGFTQGQYVALDPDIEDAAPDRGFYDEFLETAKITKVKRAMVNTVLNNAMVRLSLDGMTCNSNWDKVDLGRPSKTITIFDPNVPQLHNSFEILNSFGHKLRFRWPIKVYSLEERLHWAKLPITHDSDFNLYNYDYNDLEPLTPLYYTSPLTYIIGFQNNTETETVLKEIKQLIKLALHQKIENKLKLKLWYAPDSFVRPYEDVLTHIVDYFNTRFTDASFLENLKQRSPTTMIKWETMAQEDEELKFLINLSPVEWRNKGEQIKL